MTIKVKVGGVYQDATSINIKHNGVYTGIAGFYVKSNGVYIAVDSTKIVLSIGALQRV